MPFNLTVTQPASFRILEKSSNISPNPDDVATPSSLTMHARILKRLCVKLDETDILFAMARAEYKRYSDRSIKQLPVLKEGEHVLTQRHPAQA